MDIKESLFDNLEELFGERLELIERTTEYGNLSDIPSALHSFYKKYSFAKMPFGSIFTVEEHEKCHISNHLWMKNGFVLDRIIMDLFFGCAKK